MDRRKLSGPFDRMLGFVVRLIVGIEQRERQGVLVGDLNISHKRALTSIGRIEVYL